MYTNAYTPAVDPSVRMWLRHAPNTSAMSCSAEAMMPSGFSRQSAKGSSVMSFAASLNRESIWRFALCPGMCMRSGCRAL